MSRPISSAMQAAIEAVRGGMLPYRAAKLHGVAQSNLSRQLNKKPREVCPACNRKMRRKQNEKV